MSYEWPIDPAELFHERRPQMLNSGLPVAELDAIRAAVTDMWADAKGGWPYEWSTLAKSYADKGQHQMAALAYGWAKFPTLANDAMRRALANQRDQYLLAAPGFPVGFERRVLDLPYRGGTTPVPVHIFAAAGLPDDAPMIIVSGGVDSWKMDIHGVLMAVAQLRIGRLMAFDIAGTGESLVPMTPDGGGEIVDGLIAEARRSGARKVAHLGISMGGYYAAQSGLAGKVDAAIDFGGPVEAAFGPGRTLQYGMFDIVANARGFDSRPTGKELAGINQAYSLRPLLDQDLNAPMLIVNGADDVHVPQHDTLVFQGRRDTEVHLIPDTGHCATSKFPEALATIAGWLPRVLGN